MKGGQKHYELSNHLGNVLATVSDKKIAVMSGANLSYYRADVVSYSDYYPFGAPMTERTAVVTPTDVRYGFNGKEVDSEINGNGNACDFGARMYDARLGRWWSVDPLLNQNSAWSAYSYAIDNPIVFVDKNGEWPGIGFMYFELDLGAGLSYGLNFVEQSGAAWDEVGTTHFVMTSALYIINQNLDKGSSDPQAIWGASVSLTINFKFNWSAETFGGLVAKGGLGVPIPLGADIGAGVAVNLGFNEDEFVIGGGVGAGAKINYINSTIQESISLTKKQVGEINDASDVLFETWTVSDAQDVKDKNGVITGFKAYASTQDSRGNIVKTDIELFSKAIKNNKGEFVSNGVWSSKEYSIQSGLAEIK